MWHAAAAGDEDAHAKMLQSGEPGSPSLWSMPWSFVCSRQNSPKEDLNMSSVVYDTFSSRDEQIRLNLYYAFDRYFRDHGDNGKG